MKAKSKGKITTRNIGRKSSKPKRVFQKMITMSLVGGDRDQLEKTAAMMHKVVNSVDTTVGGMYERDITVTHESTKAKQVFLGKI